MPPLRSGSPYFTRAASARCVPVIRAAGGSGPGFRLPGQRTERACSRPWRNQHHRALQPLWTPSKAIPPGLAGVSAPTLRLERLRRGRPRILSECPQPRCQALRGRRCPAIRSLSPFPSATVPGWLPPHLPPKTRCAPSGITTTLREPPESPTATSATRAASSLSAPHSGSPAVSVPGFRRA